MKGVTLEKSFPSQEYSLKQAMLLYGLVGVARAGGVKTAVRANEWRDEHLVASYQEQSDIFHRDYLF
jgi:hypothetical protein